MNAALVLDAADTLVVVASIDARLPDGPSRATALTLAVSRLAAEHRLDRDALCNLLRSGADLYGAAMPQPRRLRVVE